MNLTSAELQDLFCMDDKVIARFICKIICRSAGRKPIGVSRRHVYLIQLPRGVKQRLGDLHSIGKLLENLGNTVAPRRPVQGLDKSYQIGRASCREREERWGVEG